MRAPASIQHRTAAAVVSGETSSSAAPPSPPDHQHQTAETMAMDPNMVVILGSLLCTIVCVLGLALVSRCACRRGRASSSDHSPPPPKGLKKKVIDTLPLPTVSFAAASPEAAAAWCSSSECTICLAEFMDGEGVRVLPQCGHAFHVACVDSWLRTCATCPSCRAAIVVTVEPTKPSPAEPTVVVVVVAGGGSRCGRCGEMVAPGGGGDDSFLP